MPRECNKVLSVHIEPWHVDYFNTDGSSNPILLAERFSKQFEKLSLKSWSIDKAFLTPKGEEFKALWPIVA